MSSGWLGRSGTRVCVCEPQSVRTACRYSGIAGLVMSKIRMPSHACGSLATASVAPPWEPPERAMVRRPAAECGRVELVRVFVEDAEAVVVAGDYDGFRVFNKD